MQSFFGTQSVDNRALNMRTAIAALTEKEEKEFKSLMQRLAEYPKMDRGNKIQFSMDVAKLSPELIFKFTKGSASFKAFCNKSNSLHHITWKKHLVGEGKDRYIGEEVLLFDGITRYSLLDQFINTHLMHQYQRLKHTDKAVSDAYLEEACQLNSLEALCERCNNNRQIINDASTSRDENDKTLAIGYISLDVLKMIQFYGTTGYLFAAHCLLELGNDFKNKSEEGSGSLAKAYHEMAVKHYLSAKRLDENNFSIAKKIDAQIVLDSRLAIFGNGKYFQQWDHIHEKMFIAIDKNMLIYEKILKEADKEIEAVVAKVRMICS